MKGWIAGTLLVALAAVAIGTGTIAQEEPPDPTPEPATETTANVEVRVWQDVRDARSIYISARPEDGSWATLGTIPLPLDDGHSGSGRFRYGDITVAVPVASATKDVEVRVWQAVRDARSVYISARPEGGSWATLGTIPLPLDDGHSSSGRFRYGDITVEVPVPLPSAPTATLDDRIEAAGQRCGEAGLTLHQTQTSPEYKALDRGDFADWQRGQRLLLPQVRAWILACYDYRALVEYNRVVVQERNKCGAAFDRFSRWTVTARSTGDRIGDRPEFREQCLMDSPVDITPFCAPYGCGH